MRSVKGLLRMCDSGYFHHFPPKSFNVAIETKASATMPGTRSMLVAQKDIKAGEVIYKVHTCALFQASCLLSNILPSGISHRRDPRL